MTTPIAPEIIQRSIIIPPKKEHRHTIIFFHGVAEKVESYLEIFTPQRLGLDLQHTKIILPAAPLQHVTAFGKSTNSWYDIKTFGNKRIFGKNEDYAGMTRTMDELLALIEYELATSTLKDSKQILLTGFSQGATISQTFAPRSKYNLASIVAFGGYTLLTEQSKDDEHYKYPIINTNNRIVYIQGLADEIVTPEFSNRSREFWKSHNVPIVEYDIPDVGHVVSNEGLLILRNVLEELQFD